MATDTLFFPVKWNRIFLFLVPLFTVHFAYAQVGLERWETSNDKSSLLSKMPPLTPSSPGSGSAESIKIDPNKKYQSVDGFGFALTGGSAQHLIHMKSAERKTLLQ